MDGVPRGGRLARAQNRFPQLKHRYGLRPSSRKNQSNVRTDRDETTRSILQAGQCRFWLIGPYRSPQGSCFV